LSGAIYRRDLEITVRVMKILSFPKLKYKKDYLLRDFENAEFENLSWVIAFDL
jgi:hypothetical protein